MKRVKLNRLNKPTVEQAREFFNWTIEKSPVFGIRKAEDGSTFYTPLASYSEFRSSKEQTLHVGKTSYTPAQPLVALDGTMEALNTLGLNYSIDAVGSFDDDRNIFAQFDIAGRSEFDVAGKKYRGLVTMAKGNDEDIPLDIWLTVIGIFCGNTFRAALRDRMDSAMRVTIKQTKGSEERVKKLHDLIVQAFGVQVDVQKSLQRMAQQTITANQAEAAFMGLLKSTEANVNAIKEMGDAGKTRLENTLGRYLEAFNNERATGNALGTTREDWFNAVTYVDTHGNLGNKRFDPDKQFVSSEFGSYARRKEQAFESADNDESFNRLITVGERAITTLRAPKIVVPELTLN